MKRLILLILLLPWAALRSETVSALVEEAQKANPELRYYEAQLAALPKPATGTPPVLAQPLKFRNASALRSALLNLDRELVQLYLAEFRFALAAEVRLRALAYQGAVESASTAADLASRIQALSRLLEQRPAAGTQALVERRILEGAALPFVRAAAEHKLAAAQTRSELNGLLGRAPEAALTVTDAFVLPDTGELPAPAERLLLAARRAELARGSGGFDSLSTLESFSVGASFTLEGLGAFDPLEENTQPGGALASQRDRLLADAQRRIERELARRTAAYAAALEVVNAIPPDLLKNLAAVSELADRQYRVGGLPVNLLLEANREWLEALEARNDAYLQAWRNRLDLELLQFPAPSGPGRITVNPKD